MPEELAVVCGGKMKKEKEERLKKLFWEWVEDRYASEWISKHTFFQFMEESNERIFDDFMDFMGII